MPVNEIMLSEEMLLQATDAPEFSEQPLRRGIMNTLQAAASCGEISLSEITRCIPEGLVTNQKRLGVLLHGLIEFLRRHDVRFSGPGEEPEESNSGRVSDNEASAFKSESLADDIGKLFDRDVAAYKEVLTREAEAELMKRVEKGNTEARDEMILRNVGLARDFAHKHKHRGVPYLDLVQECLRGVMRAIDGKEGSNGKGRFDYRKGNKFSTYAMWWVRQYGSRAILEQGCGIRVPVHVVESIGKTLEASGELLQRLGREPTAEEIARELDVEVALVKRNLAALKLRNTSCLDSPLGEGNAETLGGMIADPNAKDPTAALEGNLLTTRVSEALALLTEKERIVLKLRFGFGDGGTELMLEEVGKVLGVSRERVRQIEAKALRKLRSPEGLRSLGEHADALYTGRFRRQGSVSVPTRTVSVPKLPNHKDSEFEELYTRVFMEKGRFFSLGNIGDYVQLEPLGTSVLNLLGYVYGVDAQYIRNPHGVEKHENIRRIAMFLLNRNGFTHKSVSAFFGLTLTEVRQDLKVVRAWTEDPAFAHAVEWLAPTVWNFRHYQKKLIKGRYDKAF